MTTPEQSRAHALVVSLVHKWRAILNLRPELIITVQVTIPDEQEPSRLGCSIHNADRTEFIVAVSPYAFDNRLQHVIVHELVHVHTIAESDGSDEDMYEIAVDQTALLIERLHEEGIV